jgi:dolichyl-phosphate-mannose-protein mannosyltransferase
MTRLNRLTLHAFAFVALTLWSWRKWADPFVDFGRELYVPWQLANGAVLYRDIAHLFGPFSQYLNALLFRMFGVSMTTLIVSNLVILAATVAGIHYLFTVSCGPAAATAASMVVLLLFGFSQYADVANYNFVCPYSHETTHSMALAVGVIVCLFRAVRDGRVRWFALSGLLFGLVLLTKAEMSLAVAVAVAAGLICAGALERPGARIIRTGTRAFAGCALVPALAFLVYLSGRMPISAAARGMAGAWMAILSGDVVHNLFYRRGMGLDDSFGNGLWMLRMFLGFVLLVAALAAVDTTWPRRFTVASNTSAGRIIRLSVAILSLGAILSVSLVAIPWTQVPRALPLIAVTAVVVFAAMFIARRNDHAAAMAVVPLVMWSAFSFVLLGKMILNARISHYGFYLAMPATLVLVVVLVWLVPLWLRNGTGRGVILQTVAALLLVEGIAVYFGISQKFYGTKTLKIGSNGDAIFAFDSATDWRGHALIDVLHVLEATPPGATVAVVPEGVMINYLSRRVNPTPYITLMVPELLTFGESVIQAAFEATPPNYILLVHKDTSEYGVPYFGSDPRNGKALMDWISTHYRTASVIGRTPLHEGGYGIAILRDSP